MCPNLKKVPVDQHLVSATFLPHRLDVTGNSLGALCQSPTLSGKKQGGNLGPLGDTTPQHGPRNDLLHSLPALEKDPDSNIRAAGILQLDAGHGNGMQLK